MPVRVSYKKQIIFGIMLLTVTIFVLEGFARLYDYQFPANCEFSRSDAEENLPINVKHQMCEDFRKIVFIHEPIRHMLPNQHFQTININEYGFRGTEISKQKPEDTFRIFVLGGSTTFGAGSTSDQTSIPGYLQTKLTSANLPFEIEVINAGVSGAHSYGESRLIKERLLQFEPDLFIVYDGWNDAVSRITIDNGTHVKVGSDEPKKKGVFWFLFRNFSTSKTILINVNCLKMLIR